MSIAKPVYIHGCFIWFSGLLWDCSLIFKFELLQLFDWMQQNEKTNIASYSSYIKFVGKSLSPLKALDIYSSIRDEATRTNVSVCNSILSCMVRSGKFESSLKMFHQMKRDGLKPDIVTYSTVCSFTGPKPELDA